jgi:hypothetical protein
MKGDKVTIHISNDVGPTQQFEVVVTTEGGTIRLEEPKASERMYDVEILNKNGNPTRVHRFAKDRVIAIIDERRSRD